MKNRVSLLFLLFILNLSTPIFSTDSTYLQVTSFINQQPLSGTGSFIKFESIDLLNNVEFSKDNTTFKVLQSGIYLLAFSAQCASNEFGATGFVDVWFEKNGKPLQGSNTRASVDSKDSVQVLNCLNINKFEAGDKVAVVFSASGPGVGISAFIQQSRPSVSSAQLVLIKVE
jgi:hypothetical protein